MATSIHLLLDSLRNHETAPLPINDPDATKSPTARLLEARCLTILRAFNERDIAAPYALHATLDFTFLHESFPGTSIVLKRRQAMYWMRCTMFNSIEQLNEVISTAVEVDEEKGHGTVWVGMKIHDRVDGLARGTEKVAIFQWRREEGLGGEKRWMWFKHMCLSARPLFPS